MKKQNLKIVFFKEKNSKIFKIVFLFTLTQYKKRNF